MPIKVTVTKILDPKYFPDVEIAEGEEYVMEDEEIIAEIKEDLWGYFLEDAKWSVERVKTPLKTSPAAPG